MRNTKQNDNSTKRLFGLHNFVAIFLIILLLFNLGVELWSVIDTTLISHVTIAVADSQSIPDSNSIVLPLATKSNNATTSPPDNPEPLYIPEKKYPLITIEKLLNITNWEDYTSKSLSQNISFINQTIFNQAPINIAPLWMEGGSVRLLIHYTSNSDYYVEWGSGGSTQIAGILVNKKAFSIEHYIPWCEKMQSNSLVQIAITLNKLQFECVDTHEKLAIIGKPHPRSNKSKIGQLYVDRIDKIINDIYKQDLNFNGIINSVLIDGRYRVACALKIFANQYVVRNKSFILVHDYFWRTKHYEEMMNKYYDLIDPKTTGKQRHGTMAVFTPKIATKELLVQSKIDLAKQIADGNYKR